MRAARNNKPSVIVLGAALLVSTTSVARAAGPSLPARDTATVLPRRAWSVGLFDPLRIGVARGVEISTHPVLDVLLSPNAVARVAFLEGRELRFVGEYGLSLPTMAMRWIGQGYVFPSWEEGGGKVGWFVVPSAAAVLAGGVRGIWTARVETAVGIPLGHNDATLPESWAPLDLVFAPALTGYRSRASGAYDHPLLPWLRVRGSLDAWMVGKTFEPARSNLYASAQIAFDVALGSRMRLVLGASVFDSDQHRTKVVCEPRCRRERVRSVDFFPVVDLVYRH